MMLNSPESYSPPSIGLRKYSSRGSNLSRGSSCSSLDLLDSPTYSPPRLVCRKSAELTRGASCRTLEMLESPHPEHVTAIKSLCHQMQSSFGPCQVWATCDHDNHFNVAFLSTSLQAWLEYAYRCEDKVLLGVLSCMAQGRKSYVKVLRIGKNVPEDLRCKAERLNTSSFQSIFNQKLEEVALHPEENHDDLSKKISSLLGCEPSHLRL